MALPNGRAQVQALLLAHGHRLLLAAIVAAALALRLYGLHWDQGGLYHPDERAVLDHVHNLRFPFDDLGSLFQPGSSWNPGWFPYGSFPLYVLKAVAWVWPPWFQDPPPGGLAPMGRALAAVWDTATVLLVYAAGARLFGRWAGVLAAAFIAFAVLHIQQSHFFVSDILLGALLTASFYCLLRALFPPQAGRTRGKGWGTPPLPPAGSPPLHPGPGGEPAEAGMQDAPPSPSLQERAGPGTGRGEAPWWWALAGLCFGLGLATKASAAPFAAVFAGAAVLHASQPSPDRPQALQQAAGGLLLAAGSAIIAFALAQPYAIIDWRNYFEDVGFESKMVRRLVDLPYTRQYIDTPAYWYHVQQLAVWGLGLPLGLLFWAGAAFSVAIAVLRRRPACVLLACWLVPYFLVAGSFQVKFMRYMLPITPALALMASGMCVWAFRAAPKPLRSAASGLLALVLLLTVVYALAYSRIYAKPHTANAAADWVLANVPAGATLLQDSGWEEGFRGLEPYRQIRTEVYEDDTHVKRQHLIDHLTETDYLLFYSNRQYGTIPRLPERYPVTTGYYQALFAGELGFRLAHQETSYPNLLGVAWADDTYARPGLSQPPLAPGPGFPLVLDLGYADESFTVYDHPKTLVFKKEDLGSPEQQRAFFGSRLPQPADYAPPSPRLMMSPDVAAAQQAGGTWSALFGRASLVNRVPFLFWYALVQGTFILALPLTLIVFRRLPDRGYLLGKTLAFLLMAYIPWLLASLRLLPFSPLSIALGLALIAAASSALLLIWAAELREFLRGRWRLLLAMEALFLAAFLGFYLVRLWDPDLWVGDQWIASIEQFARGGEKPMDFAYFNAVVRSTYMPPYDPWFAGGYMNYYYFGMFLNAVPTKLLGTIPSKAIVTAVPFFFALTLTAAFSVGYNLAALAAVGKRGFPNPLWAGAAAAFLVAIAGNLDGLVQIAQGALRVLDGEPFGTFDYWRSSRMMPDDLQGITEFPFWTFLFADPHAHLWVLPLTLLAAGLALTVFLSRGRAQLLPFVLLGLTLGAILSTNSWDVITYAFVAALAVLLGELVVRPSRLAALGWAAVKTAALGGLTLLFVLPYYLAYDVPVREDPQGVLAAVPLIGGVLGVFTNTFNRSEFVTPLWRYLAIHSLFLFAVMSWLVWSLFPSQRAAREREKGWGAPPLPPAGGPPLHPLPGGEPAEAGFGGAGDGALSRDLGQRPGLDAPPAPSWEGVWSWLWYGAAVAGAAVLLAVAGYATAAFLAGVLLAAAPLAWRLVAKGGQAASAEVFVCVLLAAALLLGIFVDLFTFSGDIGRLNTVFKFYLQAWVLFALASAYALWRLGFGAAVRPLAARLPWSALLLILLAAALVYPVMATPVRSQARFNPIPLTIDGMTFMDTAVYHDDGRPIVLKWDKEAIEWLQDNLRGSPVIVEGITPLYRWGGRVSVYTGLPAVIGWDHHQKQQRGDYAGKFTGVDQRRREVDQFYTTPDQSDMFAFIQRYNVRYIYVGELERLYYPPAGLDKFERALGSGLEVAHANEQVRIYRVSQS